MLDFMPEREKFIDGVADRTWRSTNQDVERFIASDTEAKMRAFLREAPPMFSARDSKLRIDDDYLASALAARAVLEAALLARETSLASDAQCTIDSIGKFGLYATEPSPERQEFLKGRSKMIEEARLLLDDPEGESAVLRDMGYAGSIDEDVEVIGITFEAIVPVGGYALFLKRMVKMNELAAEARGTANHWSAEWCAIDADDEIEEVDDAEDADGLHLMGALGYYEESDRGIRCALSNLCDFLMTLHMGDMRTISIGGQEVRSIATGIGSLWWSALDAMRIGRLGACEVCGKPFITNNERGKRRKYCSEACKQWRKVHPGETRMEKVRPTPPEWARLDR